jgi:hypothetical protein
VAYFGTQPSDYELSEALAEMHESINLLQSSDMTDEEAALLNLTQQYLKTLSNWSDWDAAFDKQLDQHFQDGTLVQPIA